MILIMYLPDETKLALKVFKIGIETCVMYYQFEGLPRAFHSVLSD